MLRFRFLSAAILIASTVPATADYLYWSDANTGKIQFGDARGPGWGGPIDYYDFTDGLIQPRGVAVDLTNRVIYLSDGFTKTISRGPLDYIGTPEVLLTSVDGLVNPKDLALDLVNGFLYWCDASAATVNRSDLDGSNPVVLFNFFDGIVQPDGIAIDVASSLIYWTDANTSKIQRGSIDGSGIPVTLYDATDGLILCEHIALDSTKTLIYWTNVGFGGAAQISTANANGSTVTPLVLFNQSDGLDFPQQIALDEVGGKIYFADSGSGTIQGGNLDGSGSPTIIYTSANGLILPYGMAFEEFDVNNLPVGGAVSALAMILALAALGAVGARRTCRNPLR